MRGRGVMLQRYHDGGLSDAKVIKAAEGLSWRAGERTRTEMDLDNWRGARERRPDGAAGIPAREQVWVRDLEGLECRLSGLEVPRASTSLNSAPQFEDSSRSHALTRGASDACLAVGMEKTRWLRLAI